MSFLSKKDKKIAVLIDPDKFDFSGSFFELLKDSPVDCLLVGGTLISSDVDTFVRRLKGETDLPVVLFPGDYNHISKYADYLLYLSLVSGRNAEYLIGQHVKSAIRVKKSGIKTIPTAYVIIDGGRETSVTYLSNTKAIPNDKEDLIVSTALAGELLGMKCIYLEAGSGAKFPVPEKAIASIRKYAESPIIIGGGLKTIAQIEAVFRAGANLAVIGTHVEDNVTFLQELAKLKEKH